MILLKNEQTANKTLTSNGFSPKIQVEKAIKSTIIEPFEEQLRSSIFSYSKEIVSEVRAFTA
ncbi:MAG: hypothetical protein RMI30_03615 [Thermodesulfovibrio sp.]|nr:hypothetical protein [Thermodesulfovibrio sp.]